MVVRPPEGSRMVGVFVTRALGLLAAAVSFFMDWVIVELICLFLSLLSSIPHLSCFLSSCCCIVRSSYNVVTLISAAIDSEDKETEENTSITEVEALMADLNTRLALSQLVPTPPPNGTGGMVRDPDAEGSAMVQDQENTSNFAHDSFSFHPQLMPAFLEDHNVAEALRRANTSYSRRFGDPAVVSSRFAPVLVPGGSTAFEWEGHLHSLDLPLPLTNHPPVQESSAAEPDPREVLPSRFLPGQETASVLQVAKRPKLRAKDVAHRQSLTSNEVPIVTPATRFWNLDHTPSPPMTCLALHPP